MDNIVDWGKVEWVILDMDGTILDLAYDNYFWNHFLPQRYAERRQFSLEQARAELEPHFVSLAHTLPWYSTDHWSALTGLDLAALKHESRHRIGPLEGAVDFLHAVRASGRALWLATNASTDSWQIKLGHTGLQPLFDRIVCSHDYGAPKEQQTFWQRFRAEHPFEPSRALFVDDSLPVLHAAREFGIEQVVAISHPDTSSEPRVITEFSSVARLGHLKPQ